MAFKTGTVTGHINLLQELRKFAEGYGTAATPVPGANTGDGTVSNYQALPAAVNETWTLTCTTGGGPGVGIFSVTGSVSGAQAAATVSEFYENAFVEFVVQDGAVDFIVGDSFTIAVTQSALSGLSPSQAWTERRWTGVYTLDLTANTFVNPYSATDGNVATYSASPGTTGTFEIRFSDATELDNYSFVPRNTTAAATDSPKDWTVEWSDDSGVTWTTVDTQSAVTGWVSATLKNFVLGTAPGRHFWWRVVVTNNNGGTETSLSGVNFFQTGQGIDVLFYSEELLLDGPGLAGTDNILVSIRAYEDPSAPLYNYSLNGLAVFDPALTLDNQLTINTTVFTPLDDNVIEYWFMVNGRRIIVVAKIGGIYMSFYLGFILPYALPSEYPYPLYIGGNSKLSTIKFTDTRPDFRGFFDPGDDSSYLREPGGAWRVFENYTGATTTEISVQVSNTWPYRGVGSFVNNFSAAFRDSPGGEYALIPIVLHSDSPSLETYGELDGAYFISGFNNLPENTVTIGADTYISIPNIFRQDRNDFVALLEA